MLLYLIFGADNWKQFKSIPITGTEQHIHREEPHYSSSCTKDITQEQGNTSSLT